MAITLRGWLEGNNGATTTATSIAIPLTGWTTANPQAGDIILVIVQADAVSETFSQSGDVYTFPGTTGDSNSGLVATTMFAYRVMQASDSGVTFSWGTAGSYNYFVCALTPDSGDTIAYDVESTVLNSTTRNQTFTPNSATAAGSNEASVILNSARESGSGANTIAQTPPSGWTTIGTGGYGGASNKRANFTGAAWKVPVGSGSVAPGSETIVAGASTNVFATVYHVLVKETVNPSVLIPVARRPASTYQLQVPCIGARTARGPVAPAMPLPEIRIQRSAQVLTSTHRRYQKPTPAPFGYPLPAYTTSQRRESLRPQLPIALRRRYQLPIAAPQGYPLPAYSTSQRRPSLRQAAVTRQVRIKVLPVGVALGGQPVRPKPLAMAMRAARRYAPPSSAALAISSVRKAARIVGVRLGRVMGLPPAVATISAPTVTGTAIRAKIPQATTRPTRAKQLPVLASQAYPQRRPQFRLPIFAPMRHQTQFPVTAPFGYPLPAYSASQRRPSLRQAVASRVMRARTFPLSATLVGQGARAKPPAPALRTSRRYALPPSQALIVSPVRRVYRSAASRLLGRMQRVPQVSAPQVNVPNTSIRAKIPQVATRLIRAKQMPIPAPQGYPLPAYSASQRRPVTRLVAWVMRRSGQLPTAGSPIGAYGRMGRVRIAAPRLARTARLAPPVVAAPAPAVPSTGVRAKIAQAAVRPVRIKQRPIAAPQGYPLPAYSASQRRLAGRLVNFSVMRHQSQKVPPTVAQVVASVFTSARARVTSPVPRPVRRYQPAPIAAALTSARAKVISIAALRSVRRQQAPAPLQIGGLAGLRRRDSAPRLPARMRSAVAPVAPPPRLGRAISRIISVRPVRAARPPVVPPIPAVVPKVAISTRARLVAWFNRRRYMRPFPFVHRAPLSEHGGGQAAATTFSGVAAEAQPGGGASRAVPGGGVTESQPGGAATGPITGGSVQ